MGKFNLAPRAVLVTVEFDSTCTDEHQRELVLLCQSAGAVVHQSLVVKRKQAVASLFIGTGKVDELAQLCQLHQIDLVVFNHDLTPVQQRNLEQKLNCRVLDRTGLILDIFALRAQSFEGKLQIELVQLEYLKSRLVHRHEGLSGQQGGIGMRGPGETQLETDRRLIANRIIQLKARLQKVHSQRLSQTKQRRRSGVFTVAMVGYTNAGKSTLFNVLSNSKVYAADQLFATLDTTSRKVFLEPGVEFVLSDTVGFIRDLSHGLIEAFKATLDSVIDADLLLHVVDASSEYRQQQIQQVNTVIHELGASHVSQIIVFNKIDLVDLQPQVKFLDDGQVSSVSVSAKAGLGVILLRNLLAQQIVARRNITR